VRNFRRFWRDTEAAALIEFAVCLPVLFLMFVGMVEFANYAQFKEKLDSGAVQIIDVINQGTNVSAAELQNIYRALPDMMEPYDAVDARIIVTMIASPAANCRPVSVWQYYQGGSLVAPAVGQQAEVGQIDLQGGDHVMSIEVFSLYRPLIDGSLTREIFNRTNNTVYTVAYARTRYGAFNVDPNTGRVVQATCRRR
jgi:Flp pilus assembly protein TadG